MMKKALSLLLLLLAARPVFSQADYVARLPVTGAFSELGVSPAEELWIGTRAGNVYHTTGIGKPWNEAYPSGPKKEEFSFGETYERVTFFSEKVLMVSGYIQDGDVQNFVYWSDDHGTSWRKVPFGPSSWLDACYASPTGKAWMSGSSQLVYYTEDSGRSWRHFNKVEKTSTLRFSSIHFAQDEKTGLFGALSDGLYRTTDNCRSWEKLPTPLSQNKYRKISREQRPEISKVRIFGSHYIVIQEGKVFISRAAPIDWQRLPDVVNFEVSASDQLYTVQKDRTIHLYDPNYTLRWQSTQRLDHYPRAIAVRNEKLFAVTYDSAYRIEPAPAHFVAAALLTAKGSIPEPDLKVRYHGTAYGADGKDLLRYDPLKKQWVRLLTANFFIANLTFFHDQLLVSNGILDQYFAFDEALKRLQPIALPPLLLGPKTANIVAFHLENGSQGCFHANNSRRSYTRKGNQFELVNTKQPTTFLPGMEPHIPATVVEALANELDRSRTQPVTFSDLGITSRDLERFDSFIDKAAERMKKRGFFLIGSDDLYRFPGENADFGFYKSTAVALASLPADQLNAAFGKAYGNWSTTTTWHRIIFVFEDGKQLVVENADDKPNYLCAPWTVDYDGLKFRTNALRFGQLVDGLTNGQFFPEVVRDKKYALFTIVNYLYQQKLLADE